MFGKWFETRRLKKTCHELNSEYKEVMRIDKIPYTVYAITHSAVLSINGYGKRKVVVYSGHHTSNAVMKSSKWYIVYGKPWEQLVSNVVDDEGTSVDEYITFYVHNGDIFGKKIKPEHGNAYVIDGDV